MSKRQKGGWMTREIYDKIHKLGKYSDTGLINPGERTGMLPGRPSTDMGIVGLKPRPNIRLAEKSPVIAEHDIWPEIPPLVIVTDEKAPSLGYTITTQENEVNLKKKMIKEQTIIPSGLVNHLSKTSAKIKEMFHKNPPTNVTITNKSELEGRFLEGSYSKSGIGLVVLAIVLYLIFKGK